MKTLHSFFCDFFIDKSLVIVYKAIMPEFDEKKIAERVRSFRLSRGMTMDNIAKMTGFTKGYISQIENSEKSPPISTLAKIATALNVDITSFLSEDEEQKKETDIDIVKGNKRKIIGSRGTPFGYTYESLAHRMAGKNMEPYVITINDQIPTSEFQHEGEEFIYIIRGKMEFYYKGKTFILEEGDSAYFNSGIPHSGRSIGKKTAKFLCMMYSYKRG